MPRPRTDFGGFKYRHVTVTALDPEEGFARCVDASSQEYRVTIRARNGKGGWPQVGDEWFISKEFLGRWLFQVHISKTAPPVISAPREGMDRGTEQIFDALIELGLVTEEGSDFRRSED